MKSYYMGVFVMLGCVACASGSTLFTYDSLSIGSSAGEIQDYMEGIAGIGVELTGGTNQPYVNNIGPLGDEYGPYVYTGGENMGWMEFRFEEPLRSCEFHWAVLNGSLRVYADDHLFLVTDPVRDRWDWRNNPDRFGGHDSSFHRLRFEGVWGEGKSGAIGIDNLIIEVVPEPATLSLLALGGLALIRRRTRRAQVMARIAKTCLLAVCLLAATNVSAQSVRVDPPGWTGQGSLDPVDFGEVAVGESASITFNVVSVGPTPLAVHRVELLGNALGAFAITSIVDPIPPEVLVDEWIEVELTYAPLELGTHTATLRIESNDHAVRFLDGPLTGTAVPEPASLGLLAIGGLALVRRPFLHELKHQLWLSSDTFQRQEKEKEE